MLGRTISHYQIKSQLGEGGMMGVVYEAEDAACVYCALNNVNDAIIAIKKAWESGYRDAIWTRQDPDLQILHGHPDFERLYPP